MTEERNTTEPGAETDALVTQTYRELARERVPNHLDRAVLKKARNAARPHYSRLRSWTRPMAWAATVMLSVAIVLEISKVPAPEGINLEDAAGRFEAASPEIDMIDDAPAEAPQTDMFEETAATAPSRSLNATSAVPTGEAAPAKTPAAQVAPEPIEQKKQHFELRQNTVEEGQLAAPAAKIDEFKLKEADMLRHAEDMARIQSGDNKESALPSSAADAGAFSAVAVSAEASACDETVTKTPETWFECITKLEEAGLTSQAQQQRKLLQDAFPEFKPH